MALVTLKEILAGTRAGHYAVGGFNFNGYEDAQGIINGAVAKNSPVILMASMGAVKYIGLHQVAGMVKGMAESVDIPVCLHLDHATDYDLIKEAIKCGFTSVMVDASAKSYEDNIADSKMIVDFAKQYGCSVEAELGKLAGVEDDVKVDARSATFTDPDEAAEFVERTGVDSLAIAIGTSHGAYKFKGDPYLDFERLKTIHGLIPETPLVLHGASTVLKEFVDKCNQYGGDIPGARGVPEDMIRESTKYGICKVNIDTDLRLALTAEVRKFLAENPAEFDPRKYLGPGRQAIKSMVQHKIKNVLGCSGSM